MKRLIDADALKSKIATCITVESRGKNIYENLVRFVLETVRDVINAQPTIDAVPVVRCYECKYFTEFEKGFSSDWDGSCRYWNTHSTVYSNFCGCGKRMDEDERD